MADNLANITYEPLRFSRNPLEYTVDAMKPLLPSRVGIRYYLELWLPKFYQSSEYVKLTEMVGSEEPPSSVGTVLVLPGATFSMEELLDGVLTLKRPNFNQKTISVCETMTIPFYAKWRREHNGVVESGVFNTQWAIKAGINEMYFEEWKDSFWTTYIGGGCRFLTFASDGKSVCMDHPEYLYFLTNFSPLPAELRLRVILTYDDDSESAAFTATSLPSPSAFTVFCIPVGPMALGLDVLPNVVKSYKVWLSDQNNLRLSEVRTYKITKKYYRNVKYLLYNNALGGYDTVMFTGSSKPSMKADRQTFERQTNFKHAPTYAEKIVNRVTGERQLTINTGYMSEKNFLAVENLLFAQDILLVTDREYIPLLNNSDMLEYPGNDEKLIGREMSFSYTNKERSVSPLPIAPPVNQRETAWRPFSFGGCVLGTNGIRTGKQAVAMLEKYYTDNFQAVKPAAIKPNTPDTDGYVAPQNTDACDSATTPFFSTQIERVGNYLRNDCPVGSSGGKATIVVLAGLYGSEISQADADAKAEANWNLQDTQAMANALGICTTSPELYVVAVPSGKFNYRWIDLLQSGQSNNIIAGGPGSLGGNGALLAYGNAWFIQNNTNPNSIISPVGSNNLQLPLNPGTTYRIYVWGWTFAKRLRVWVNGVLTIDQTITVANFQDMEGSVQIALNVPLPNQAMVYSKITAD